MKMPKSQLQAFVIQNHRYMTYQDMADETGVSYPTIREVCTALNLPKVSKSDITKQYITDMRGKLSLADIVKRLDMAEAYVINLAWEIGLTRADFDLPNQQKEKKVRNSEREVKAGPENGTDIKSKNRWPTPREVLSSYQHPDARHFHNFRKFDDLFAGADRAKEKGEYRPDQ